LCVPSTSNKISSDISLFEHSKIIAAISICIYNYLLQKYEGNIEKFADVENKEEYRYLLLLADISGIQSFIYNIGHKGASKALKGRSFFLQQMLENIAYYMLDKKLFLPITNLIYSSGGKFYILAPNTKKKLALEEIKKELENKFLETYDGSLGISIAAIELNGNDLKYNENLNEHPISEKWNELNLQVEKKTKI